MDKFEELKDASALFLEHFGNAMANDDVNSASLAIGYYNHSLDIFEELKNTKHKGKALNVLYSIRFLRSTLK